MKTIKNILIALIALTILSGCVINQPEDYVNSHNNVTNTSSHEIFDNTQSVKVKKDITFFSKGYTVKTDDDKKLKVKGKTFSGLTGEQLTMTHNGDLISYENQSKRWNINVNRLATVYNQNDDVMGFIGEDNLHDMFQILNLNQTHLYDAEGNKIAVVKIQILSLMTKYDIYDMDNNHVYTISTKFALMDTFEIVKHNDTEIPFEFAIYTSIILNEIANAED